MEIKKSAILVLEDGTIFKGKSAGFIGTTSGEICFNTGMTGYQEIFTDPSYYGQVIVTTNAHIGNYGVKEKDEESEKVQISGLICKNFTNDYSRKMADEDLDKYFVDNKIVCIYEVDTREIVRKIRDGGAMNCIISSETEDVDALLTQLKSVPSMEGLELSSKVTTADAYELGDPNSDVRIAVLDYGTKKNILRCFTERGAFLKVFPAKTAVEELLAFRPDGFFLSNGPGDPAAMDYAITTVKALLQLEKPLFGICLGHQLLALASDVDTFKMHHGHRGINHPVKNIISGYCEITSQNHGFAVSAEQLKSRSDIEITHMNLNDNSIEGIRLVDKPAFSVQYHPEAAPGPHDSRYLFDQFIESIRKSKNN
ncbi:MAG: glutamine-hydrolyzing carbamoyl-phosphate synthase small subunit [Saprospiraceae bacterium]|nr:glutamine-hydrolyzing carbamoyl-phosphate synthase small subunit [Saprospiraceae bacterium]MBP7643453.1 glutamine-hydrolyzing carbamoyl-phosphate synthase small subunit [Saprospiraceae bacterium]